MSSLANQGFGSESEEDEDFNPAPEVGSDDEADGHNRRDKEGTASNRNARDRNDDEDEDEDEDEDVRPARSKLHSRKNGNSNNDEAEEDGGEEEEDEAGDEDEEGGAEDLDEDEDEEEDEEDRPRKRHKRDRRLQFIDVEAEVDDEEEDEELEEDDLPDGTHPDDLLDLPPGADTDDRRHRELDRQRELEAGLDAEKMAETMKERYGRLQRPGADISTIPQHLLLPSVEDPTIWAVKCKPGKENEVVASIWKRWMQRMGTREALQITSAFARGGSTMMGYVYVEARRQADVLVATDQVNDCYPRSQMQIIPINEMPELLRVQKPKPLEPGMWVRIKRPAKYAGDLAKIDAVDTIGSEVTVQLIPRIDYGVEEDVNAPQGIKRKKPGTIRPSQRLFSEQEARKRMSKSLTQLSALGRKHFQFQGEQFVDGFLLKDFKTINLQVDDVNPKLDEVAKFAAGGEDGAENLDLAGIAATLKTNASSADFVPGDVVEVYQGEQSGVKGKAVSVIGDIVTITVSDGPMRGQKLEAPTKTLRKLFREGDHVRVIGGSKFRDEVGMVVKVREDRITFVTDSDHKEITVFSRDLREANDTSGTHTHAIGMMKYDLHDLVQLDAATAAVVVKVDRESLRVIDQNGTMKDVLPSSVSNRLDRKRNIVATDRDGHEIRNDDPIKEYGGDQRQGKVLHVYRNFIFILSRQQTENAGVFVLPRGGVQSVASRNKAQAPDLSKMNPAMQRNGAHGSSGPQMGPPKMMGRDRLIGKTVTVKRGVYKTLLGIVKDTTDKDARVELHTKGKIITLPKDHLSIKDPNTGETMSLGPGGSLRSAYSGGGGGGGNRSMPLRTPMSRVPDAADGSRTPFGNRAPWGSGNDGNKTPAWGRASAGGDNSGGRTPAYGSYGGRTAYGGDGSRTAYGGDGSRTAYGGSTGYGRGPADAGYSGSRTPYGGSGGQAPSRVPLSAPTPGVVGQTPGAMDAPTPAPYTGAPTPGRPWDAPTPGGPATGRYEGAPTPGGWNAPTPGDHLGAPTPGAALSAPTPRAWDAPTPGGRAWDAPTPGGALGAPTPGAALSAPTPGAWNAPTPGFSGYGDDNSGAADDDGPRYE